MPYNPGDPRPSDEIDAPHCVRVVNITSKPLSLDDLVSEISSPKNLVTIKDILSYNPHFRLGPSDTIAPGNDVFVPGFYYVPGKESQIGGKKISDDAGANWKVTQWANQNLFGPVPNEGCWAKTFGTTPRKSIIRIIGSEVQTKRDLNGNRFDWDRLPGKDSD